MELRLHMVSHTGEMPYKVQLHLQTAARCWHKGRGASPPVSGQPGPAEHASSCPWAGAAHRGLFPTSEPRGAPGGHQSQALSAASPEVLCQSGAPLPTAPGCSRCSPRAEVAVWGSCKLTLLLLQCSSCAQQFMQKKDLQSHMIKLHGAPKPHAVRGVAGLLGGVVPCEAGPGEQRALSCTARGGTELPETGLGVQVQPLFLCLTEPSTDHHLTFVGLASPT